MVAKTIENDGLIYIFGCGHSHLIALDCFYRAGGLANVYPILDGKLMLHESASYSSVLEKDEILVYSICIMDCYNNNICYKYNNEQLPFGCHSWYKRRMKKFWFPIILGK